MFIFLIHYPELSPFWAIIITPYLMRHLLVVILLVAPMMAKDCQPLYWEIDPDYQAPLNETAVVAAQTLVLGDVKTSHGIYPENQTYTVYDIKGKGSYDASKVQARIVKDSIEVTGGVINLDFQLYLITKKNIGKGYDGNATASLNNITVNYTKKPALVKGAAIWTLGSLSPSIPNNLIPNNDTAPPFRNPTDRKIFENLITTDLYAEVSAYYNMNLTSLYAMALQNQSMSKTFNSSTFYTYVYPGTGSSVNVNVSVSNFSISEQNGVALGYYGQVQGNADRCSQFVPSYTEKASYITKDLILAMWEGFAKTSVWQPNTLDSTLLKSRYFKFRMVDLDAISPKITSKFSNLLEPLVAQCSLKTFTPSIEFDQENQRLGTTLDWTCSLVRTAGDLDELLKLSISMKYKVIVEQQYNKLKVRIADTEIVTSQWIPTAYPIENQDLANIYLKDLASSLSIETIGDGFLQPNRVSPRVIIEEDHIKIVDEAGILQTQ